MALFVPFPKLLIELQVLILSKTTPIAFSRLRCSNKWLNLFVVANRKHIRVFIPPEKQLMIQPFSYTSLRKETLKDIDSDDFRQETYVENMREIARMEQICSVVIWKYTGHKRTWLDNVRHWQKGVRSYTDLKEIIQIFAGFYFRTMTVSRYCSWGINFPSQVDGLLRILTAIQPTTNFLELSGFGLGELSKFLAVISQKTLSIVHPIADKTITLKDLLKKASTKHLLLCPKDPVLNEPTAYRPVFDMLKLCTNKFDSLNIQIEVDIETDEKLEIFNAVRRIIQRWLVGDQFNLEFLQLRYKDFEADNSVLSLPNTQFVDIACPNSCLFGKKIVGSKEIKKRKELGARLAKPEAGGHYYLIRREGAGLLIYYRAEVLNEFYYGFRFLKTWDDWLDAIYWGYPDSPLDFSAMTSNGELLREFFDHLD